MPTTAEDVVRRIADSYVGWQENSFPGLLGNVAAGRIANRLDLGGTNCVVDAACASSLSAVHLAMLELAAGRCDIVVTGGLDTFNDIFMYMCFSKTPALSPTGDARPFDAAADGTILGEGLGILVLKRLADARRDGDRIYAVIRSMGTSSDGKGQAVYAPSAGRAGQGTAAGLRSGGRHARHRSSWSRPTAPAPGSATRPSWRPSTEVYRRRESGHALVRPGLGQVADRPHQGGGGRGGADQGGAGASSQGVAADDQGQPADRAAGLGRLAVLCEHRERPWLPRRGHPRRAAVSAFGFGGSNFHCVLEEAEPEPAAIDWDGDVQILAYSDDDPGRLAAELPRWTGEVAWQDVRQEAARGRAAFRHQHRYRLLMVARRGSTEPCRLIEEAAARLSTLAAGHGESPGTRRSGRTGIVASESRAILVGTGPARGSLALLFPGQGSQSVGMFRDLACRFPRMQAALASLERRRGPRRRQAERPDLSPVVLSRGRPSTPARDPARHPVRTARDRCRLARVVAHTGGFRRPSRPGGRAQLRRADRAVRGRTNRRSDAGDALAAARGPDGRLREQRRPGSHARGVRADRSGGKFDRTSTGWTS